MAKVKINIDDKLLKKIQKNIVGHQVDPWVIHDGVEYGVYQEFGSKLYAGRPALVPAFERHTKALPQLTGAAIEAGVDLNDIIAKMAFDIQKYWQDNVNVDTGAYRNSIKAEPK